MSSLDDHDLVYERPALQWEHGVPLGNGFFGVMAWGDGRPLHLTLDHPEFFDDRQGLNDHPLNNYRALRDAFGRGDRATLVEAAMNHMRRQGAKNKPPRKVSAGWADLLLPEGVAIAAMRLRLRDATLALHLTDGTVLEMFACADRPVLCLRTIARGRVSFRLGDQGLQLVPKGDPDAPPGDTRLGVSEGSPPVHCAVMPIGDGGAGAIAWCATPDGDGLLLTVQHRDAGDPGADAATALRAAAQDWPSLHAAHARRWSEFWAKSSITIPDGRLEALWYVELYKINACSRRGALLPNLQGLWPPHGQRPPWGGEHANNINTQMFYWPVYATNHMELLEPLHDWLIDEQLPAGRAYAGKFYGYDRGAYFHTSTIGRRAYCIGLYATCTLWPAVGAWWVMHLWWSHLYRPDAAFLRERAYPFMRAAMEFYEQYLEPDAQGVLHVPLTHSPEWRESEPEAFCADSTIDLSLLRYAARAAAEAARQLGLAEEARHWQSIADRLPPYPCDKATGLHIHPGQPLSESHRHHSHLTPIFPAGDWNVDGSKEERELIHNSLVHLQKMGTGQWTGFGVAWAACLVARVGWGNWAWRLLDIYVGAFLSPNSFNLNGDFKNQGVSFMHYTPYTNEAGSGAAEAVNQMLLQSWGGVIRLFPAIPAGWREASFTDLRAEGGFLVSAELRDRRIARVTIRSESGGPCVVLNSFGGPVLVEGGADGARQADGPRITVASRPGDVIVLRPLQPVPATTDQPPRAKQRHYFGVQRTGELVTPPIDDPLRGARL